MQDAPITESIARAMLLNELRSVCLPCVVRLCPILVQYELKLNAICDFVYNLGGGRLQTSTLRRFINIGDWESAADELMKWTRGGGKILPGLVARRTEEAKHIRG